MALRVLRDAETAEEIRCGRVSSKGASIFRMEVVEYLVFIEAQGGLSAKPNPALAILGDIGNAAGGHVVTAGEFVEVLAVIPTGTAVAGSEPQAVLAVGQDAHDLVAAEAGSAGIGAKFVAVETTYAIVIGGEPQIALVVFGDVLDLDAAEAFGQ